MEKSKDTFPTKVNRFIEKLLGLHIGKLSKSKANRRSSLYRRRTLKDYLEKAGYPELDPEVLYRNVFWTTFSIILVTTLAATFMGVLNNREPLGIVVFLAALWTFVFILLWIFIWVIVYFYLDMRIYRRTMELEEVLPDFLQLTSANIFAGMPVDRALWYAVRPRFGVLAREIEDVAKKTIAGEDLERSLILFTRKYESNVLKRSISLLLEGMRSGGEMTDLLNKIAIDIQEARLLRKEMAASVMTYVIFITFAAIIIAPFLFGLATQLLIVITSIMQNISQSGSATGMGSLKIQMSGESVSLGDFKIFSYFMLALQAFFSACIISSIRKGT
ncbi:MAG: hypothetical protein HC945_01090, partial [Nitrosarchaeum sp.]|nr:hypothetical protein [Nitrosarchaeum sp.]